MEIHQIRALQAVARHGSFSMAAKSLGRTQPAITLALQSLEKEVGLALFEQEGRGRRLSEAGRVLVEQTGPMLALWDRLPDAVRRTPAKRSVRIGASHTAAHHLLPGPCADFLKAHPDVTVEIRQQTAGETWDMLRRGELDFAVRSPAAPPPDLIWVPLAKIERHVLAPLHFGLPKSKLSMDDLHGRAWVIPARDSRFRRILETALEEAGLPFHVAVEAGNWEAVKRYVSIGIGAALVPGACLGEDERRSFAAYPAGRLFGRDTYGILCRGGLALSTDARAFVETIDPRAAAQL